MPMRTPASPKTPVIMAAITCWSRNVRLDWPPLFPDGEESPLLLNQQSPQCTKWINRLLLLTATAYRPLGAGSVLIYANSLMGCLAVGFLASPQSAQEP